MLHGYWSRWWLSSGWRSVMRPGWWRRRRWWRSRVRRCDGFGLLLRLSGLDLELRQAAGSCLEKVEWRGRLSVEQERLSLPRDGRCAIDGPLSQRELDFGRNGCRVVGRFLYGDGIGIVTINQRTVRCKADGELGRSAELRRINREADHCSEVIGILRSISSRPRANQLPLEIVNAVFCAVGGCRRRPDWE